MLQEQILQKKDYACERETSHKRSVWDLHQFVRISPETAVIIAVPPEGVFKQLQDSVEGRGRIRGMLELPYPAGADSMILQIQCGSEKLEDL